VTLRSLLAVQVDVDLCDLQDQRLLCAKADGGEVRTRSARKSSGFMFETLAGSFV
jgi:hypothetical protein